MHSRRVVVEGGATYPGKQQSQDQLHEGVRLASAAPIHYFMTFLGRSRLNLFVRSVNPPRITEASGALMET